MAIELSRRTREHVAALFADADREVVTSLLEEECADNLPLWHGTTPEDFERVRFAALKVSGGRLDALLEGIQLAQVDWRDLLVAADFANEVDAHLAWRPGRRAD